MAIWWLGGAVGLLPKCTILIYFTIPQLLINLAALTERETWGERRQTTSIYVCVHICTTIHIHTLHTNVFMCWWVCLYTTFGWVAFGLFYGSSGWQAGRLVVVVPLRCVVNC